MGDASPSGSYILATLPRIPRFVGSAFSSGKLTVIVSFSLSHGKPSKEAHSLLGMFNCFLAYVSSLETGAKLAASNSFTFECHLCSSNVPSANMLVDVDLITSVFSLVGAPLIRSSTYKLVSISRTISGYLSLQLSNRCCITPPRRNGEDVRSKSALVNLSVSTFWLFRSTSASASRSCSLIRTQGLLYVPCDCDRVKTSAN